MSFATATARKISCSESSHKPCLRMGCGNSHCITVILSFCRIVLFCIIVWWGFSNANDRQKIFAFIRRCSRTSFCSPDLADFHDLYISSNEKLFNKILTCQNHILRTLLPPSTAWNYSLRNRPHNRQLPDRISRITNCNFEVFKKVSSWVLQ